MDRVYDPVLTGFVFADANAHTATRTPTGAIGLTTPSSVAVKWVAQLKRWRKSPLR